MKNEKVKWLDTVEDDYLKFYLLMDCFICKMKTGNLILKAGSYQP